MVTATPGAWFFKVLGGIRSDPKQPRLKHFSLRTGIVDSVETVKSTY
jgi:hypothetical protein